MNQTSKPVVFYRGKAIPFLDRALLYPVNHPNHLEGHEVTNRKQVITSRIINWSLTTGCIETANTIYTPELKTDTDNSSNEEIPVVTPVVKSNEYSLQD